MNTEELTYPKEASSVSVRCVHAQGVADADMRFGPPGTNVDVEELEFVIPVRGDGYTVESFEIECDQCGRRFRGVRDE